MTSEIAQSSASSPQELIQAALCERILSGALQPGEQLPTVAALKEEFGVAMLTMQRALERLKQAGITHAIRGKGIYVNERAPCLTRIGLVFPAHRNSSLWSLLYEALLSAGQEEATSLGYEVVPYYGQGTPRDEAEHTRLVDDIKQYRLAGILFAVNPFEIAGTLPVSERLPIPRVAVMSGMGYADICAIYPDLHSFGQKAAECLAEKGARRAACIATINWPRKQIAGLIESFVQKGVDVPVQWTQAVPFREPHWARNCAHQLFSSSHVETPDCLVITDDHLVDAVLAGLQDAGRTPGTDVHVIAYRNHPSPYPMVSGIKYIGADLFDLFRQALNTMTQKRLGMPFSQVMSLPAKIQEFSPITHGSQLHENASTLS